ncbi:MAG TPA: HisA/HisF-related TIM barrel protein [Gemmatimonadaceae bacterium]|jgi:phosphoribosylformimino-5-aminoimidazole carboxamide ribotide isomerase
MLVVPAIDLRDGACVQVADGAYDPDLIRSTDPAAVALTWRQHGFEHLHVIDLNAVTGRGQNREQVDAVLSATDAQVHVGGGIRDRETIEDILSAGAQRVVVGRRALDDREWLDDMAGLFPACIIVAMDVRDRKVLSRGWARQQSRLAVDIVEELNEYPVAGVMVSAVNQGEPLTTGVLALLEDLTDIAEFPIYASGGLESLSDLRALSERGVAAAIVGIALYNGAIDPRVAAEEFSASAEFFS